MVVYIVLFKALRAKLNVHPGHCAVGFVYFYCFLFTQSVVSSQRLVMQERRERNHGKKMETTLVFNGP